jgi:hypothetical protein
MAGAEQPTKEVDDGPEIDPATAARAARAALGPADDALEDLRYELWRVRGLILRNLGDLMPLSRDGTAASCEVRASVKRLPSLTRDVKGYDESLGRLMRSCGRRCRG